MAKCKPLIIPFIVTSELSFIVEISFDKIRFYADHGAIVSGGSVYTINSPYLYSDMYDENGISRIQYVQNGDIMYLFHEKYPVKKLVRNGNTNWSISDMEFIAPWDHPNTDDVRLTASAIDGSATLTSDVSFFTNDMIDKYIRLTEEDSSVAPWVASTSYTTGATVKSDGKQYVAANTATSGTVKPVHSRGIVSDGAVKWQYKNAGYGIAKITAITDSRHASITITDSLPQAVTSEGTTYFEMSIFSGKVKSYPMAGTFFRNRFCILAQIDNVPTVYCSNSDDYENFADKDEGEVQATNSITIPLTNGSYNKACWIYGGDVMFVGTSAAEYMIDSAASSEAFAPDNAKTQIISEIGSLPIKPVKIGSQLLFVSRSGKEIKDILYSFTTDAYETNTMSLQGRHLIESGIKSITYQTSPERTVWLLTEKKLIGVTYSIEDKVVAFYRADLSGTVQNMAIIPNPVNKLDELWVTVERQNTTSLEWLDNNFVPSDDDELTTAEKNGLTYLDSCVSGIYSTDRTENFNTVISITNTFSGMRRDITIYTNEGDPYTVGYSVIENPRLSIFMTSGDLMDLGYNSSEILLEWQGNSFIDNPTIYVNTDPELIGYTYDIYKDDTLEAHGIISGSGISATLPMSFGIQTFRLHIYKKIDLSGDRTVTGLGHLEGMKVRVIADGAQLDDRTVVNGSITIPFKCQNVTVGLPIESAFIPQNIYIQGNNSSGVGDVQRIDHVTLMLWRSMGGKIGKDFNSLQDIYFRKTDEKMDNPTPLYTGNKEIPVDMRTSFIKEKGASILIYNDSVFPMNILAIVPHFTTSGNGK